MTSAYAIRVVASGGTIEAALALASSTHVIFVGQAGLPVTITGLLPEEYRAVASGVAAIHKATRLESGQATERSEATVSKGPDVILSDGQWTVLEEALREELERRHSGDTGQRLLRG
jgi:hypothetical protein